MLVSFSFLPDSLCSVLWNLYHFYKQFLDPVKAKIMELRSPIEKELKVR
jgi:midasin